MKGMTPETVERVAEALDDAIEKINSGWETVTREYESLGWSGPDATTARDTWNTDIAPRAQEVLTWMKDAAREAREHVTEQRRVSQG